MGLLQITYKLSWYSVISHSARKPTALCPGLVLGPDFASPCFVRARYQAGFNVDW